MLNDNNDAWLKPAFAERYRVLKPDSFAVSFYGWAHADRFLTAFRAAEFRVVGHFVFQKRYTSKTSHVRYHRGKTGTGRKRVQIGLPRLSRTPFGGR